MVRDRPAGGAIRMRVVRWRPGAGVRSSSSIPPHRAPTIAPSPAPASAASGERRAAPPRIAMRRHAPLTPVPLVCAALQSLDREFVGRAALEERIGDLCDVLRTLNAAGLADGARDAAGDATGDATGDAACGVAPRAGAARVLDRAYPLLRLRRVLLRQGSDFVVLPHGRELVSYYPNSIAHLLGPYEAAVRARDALPMQRALDAVTVPAR